MFVEVVRTKGRRRAARHVYPLQLSSQSYTAVDGETVILGDLASITDTNLAVADRGVNTGGFSTLIRVGGTPIRRPCFVAFVAKSLSIRFPRTPYSHLLVTGYFET